jgi:hypothetical protein
MGLSLSPLLSQIVSHIAGTRNRASVGHNREGIGYLLIDRLPCCGSSSLLMAGGRDHNNLLQTPFLVNCVEKEKGEQK